MRRALILCSVLIGLLFLSACGGRAPAPTATLSGANVQITSTPIGATPDLPATQTAEPTLEQLERSFGTDEPTLPVPGTVIVPTTPDPNAGLVFDSIQYERTGGIAGKPLSIEVKSDGTVTRNGVTSTITSDQVAHIDQLIDQLNFFSLQGVFTSPGSKPDVYHYSVTVNRGGDSRTINAEDGFLPPELSQFFSLLNSLGAPTP